MVEDPQSYSYSDMVEDPQPYSYSGHDGGPSVRQLQWTWWRTLSPTATDRYPHERYGNAGTTSHSPKTATRDDFLEFVDMNNQLTVDLQTQRVLPSTSALNSLRPSHQAHRH